MKIYVGAADRDDVHSLRSAGSPSRAQRFRSGACVEAKEATKASVANRIAEQATPLRLDLDAPFDDLAPLANRARDATVVALGSATRQSHELCVLTHRVMRFLIDEHGFRSLALEGDEAASLDLDRYVRTGKGDPLAILAQARPFLWLAEILEAVRWIRARNERNSSDPVRVVHVAELPREVMGQLAGTEDVEHRVGQTMIGWHQQTGHRIVYWGGLAHTGCQRRCGPFFRRYFHDCWARLFCVRLL